MKICSKCKKEKGPNEFQRRRHDTPFDLRAECRTCVTTYAKGMRDALRDEAIAAYGGKCTCCGECEKVFLAIDHVNDDGYAHRAKLGSRSSDTTFRFLKKNAYPAGFQVLCFNCNEAKKYGICPHQLAKES